MARTLPATEAGKRAWWIGLLLFGLAALVRVYRLNQGLTYDEIFSALYFFRAPWQELVTRMPFPNHHPLYSLMAKVCIGMWGEREWAMRLPSFLLGSATAPLVFVTGRRIWGDRTAALAGFFFGVAFWPVWFSQDARGYAAMMFFCLLATRQFLLLREGFTAARALVYLGAMVAAIYSHLYSANVFFAHLATALIIYGKGDPRAGKRRLGLAAAGLFVSGLLYAPLLAGLYFFVATRGKLIFAAGHSLTLGFIRDLFLTWSGGTMHPWLSLLVILPAAGGLVGLAKKNWPLMTIWVLSLLIGFLVPLLSRTFTFDRFYAYALPGFYLLAAGGLSYLVSPGSKARRAAGALAIAATAAVLLLGLARYYRYDKQGYRSAAAWVHEQAPSRRVLTKGLNNFAAQYYFPSLQIVPADQPLSAGLLRGAVAVIGYVEALSRDDQAALAHACRPPAVFPSSGPPEAEVRVYVCE